MINAKVRFLNDLTGAGICQDKLLFYILAATGHSRNKNITLHITAKED